jgi:tRNA A37 methylthiotransferase MiaB
MDSRAAEPVPGTFAVVNASCHRRLEDVAAVGRFLTANGWTEGGGVERADLVVFMSCGGFRINVDEALPAIADVRGRMKPGAALLVGGCLPHTGVERLRTVFPGIPLTYADPSALDALPGVTTRFREMAPKYGSDAVCDALVEPDAEGLRALRRVKRSVDFRRLLMRVHSTPALRRSAFGLRDLERVVISIGAGCSRACSYCAKRFARGPVCSKPVEVVMRQVARATELGYRTFDLYADSIGDYGHDLGTSLAALLERVAAFDAPISVGIYDLHPDDFLRDFEPILALSRADRLHYLYVVTESGSDRVLESMGRPRDTAELVRRLLTIRRNGAVFMQSAVIVGYPGETDQDFEQTVALLERVSFDHVHVHCYCDMPNTPSSRLEGKVTPEVLSNRLQRMARSRVRFTPSESQREFEHSFE